jgi:isoaspartyl peptidase/L-asparaginase-like protein (Ntn-hydrolase superfamily)
MAKTTLAAAGGLALRETAWGGASTAARPVLVSTWNFGQQANETALAVMQQGGSTLDGVEQGIWVTEADLSNASVGIGGTPNAEGVVQLDACIMWGPGHKAGSVAAIEGIAHPISAARRVMEKTSHVMLVGEGAKKFALAQGLETAQMPTEERRRAWLQWQAEQEAKKKAQGHDTIALVVLDAQGHLAGGCSTSGRGYKLPGRVGDSPILGSGLYVDEEVGAAGATGIGENVMRYCGSFLVVEYLRQGLHPQEACAEVVRRICKSEGRADLSINFIALDRQGRHGAAGTDEGFQYALTTPEESGVRAPLRAP